MTSSASLVLPVEVVKFFGAIHAQADQELVFVKEPAPLAVEKNAVGLEGVFDPGTGFGVFSLGLNRVAEEIETRERRLTALPCDGDLGNLVGFEKLPDVGFVHLLRHPEIASRVAFLLLEEKAVSTAQIAGRTCRLRHDVKSLGGIGCESQRQTLCAPEVRQSWLISSLLVLDTINSELNFPQQSLCGNRDGPGSAPGGSSSGILTVLSGAGQIEFGVHYSPAM